ncbi:MAG: hypothetical protein ACFFAH_11830 [Promethearchaeota archaeon]
MKINSIKCEVIDVKTDSGICVGLAKTKIGEKYIIDGRTPESNGMCSNAFCALSNAVFIMMASGKIEAEKNSYIDRVCPHGVVTFRISRSKKDKVEAFNEK